ncbi:MULTISPECIES: hypothetical protein [unclassified Carboxylicivirga]|uniref:hypothetical protein n=1 Tax=Carboxylicivirga TaxID=1628153 RepID=UPI003D32F699
MKINTKLPLSRQVLIVSLLSLIWIVIYKMILIDIEEFFPKAYEVGEIMYGLTASIVASSIFYYIVVYRPANDRFHKVKPYIEKRISRFKLDNILIVQDIYNYKGLEVPKMLPENWEDFRTVCDGILLTSKPPIIHANPSYQPKNWFEYFEYYIAIEDSNKRMLYNYWEDVPIEVKTLIEELQTNTFHSGLNLYKQTGYSNKLYDLAGPLWNHLSILSKLPETLNENLKI